MTELMRTIRIPLTEIYVPAKLSKEVDGSKVDSRAEELMADGLKSPIQVRRDEERKRYVLVAGVHRLEAARALGEDAIEALIVQARKR